MERSSLKRQGNVVNAYFNFVYYPLRDDTNNVTGVIVVATEVTEQVRAKFRIQESENKFRSLVMRSPVPMCILRGRDLFIEIANAVMIERIWQRNESEVIGKKLFDVFPELKDQPYADLVLGVLDSGKVHNEREAPGFIIVDGKPKQLFMDYEYTPLFDDTREVWGVLVTIADVTEMVEARKRVEENEAKLNVVIEASQMGTWEVNFKTNQVAYSDRYLEMVIGRKATEKYSHQQLISRIHPDDLKLREEGYKRALETGVLHYVTRVIWDDGSIHWIEGRGKMLYDNDGKPDKMLGTSADITDERMQKEMLEKKVQERTAQLAQKNTDLERMNAELQSFAYISSHDLQEPLRKIQTFTSRIRGKENLSETGRDFFERIQRSAHQMQVLIQDLLAYSRTGRQEHTFETIDFENLISEVRNDFHEAMVEKDAKIELLNTALLNVIPLQFKQVINNLVSNALKFSKENVPPYVTLSVDRSPDLSAVYSKLPEPNLPYLKISIIDNGIGFEPLYNEKIFDVFQRLQGKHEYSGTGIGLAIVKRIVDNHKGHIEAHSELGKGARFDLYLPAI